MLPQPSAHPLSLTARLTEMDRPLFPGLSNSSLALCCTWGTLIGAGHWQWACASCPTGPEPKPHRYSLARSEPPHASATWRTCHTASSHSKSLYLAAKDVSMAFVPHHIPRDPHLGTPSSTIRRPPQLDARRLCVIHDTFVFLLKISLYSGGWVINVHQPRPVVSHDTHDTPRRSSDNPPILQLLRVPRVDARLDPSSSNSKIPSGTNHTVLGHFLKSTQNTDGSY
ncbi:hypothetical protein EDB84DRAFT_155055 [Lactarius hengduanensis]|nr:hypothetical protein EDB84DRAFT_155055 [Lactarius hengduanensis]